MESIIKVNQGDTKWDIRHKVWNYIEVKNLASFPRPVHNRIPNFKGALEACEKVLLLEIFTKAAVVKVDPDKPLEGVRLASLQARKTLLVPTPRLKTGLFNRIITPKGATRKELHVCSTSQGVKEMSVPVGLDDKVQVDLVVVGSVAVSNKGYRIGKGEGFADMEYAMMACMGAVCESTVVVTIVHDCQVVDIPEELTESHDLTVDFILTPTRIIKTECTHPKPQGIIWSKVSSEDNRCAGFECKFPKTYVTTISLSNIPARLRVSELKSLLREHVAVPLRISWKGTKHRVFLLYSDDTGA
uniref:Methenyltetrahydrofolate synthase domain-containing protein n=1 Tax=Cyprinus carpio TaxID=7962 RepID=A0A8C2HWU2_CYPCA